MYIKRLEISGFKSFPERTVLPLGQGISAVVGPNGCGKSNIIDAIRWVMGEQSPKLLRGRNMDDVLFNGSQNRPASALAEVTLTLARDYDLEKGVMAAAETAVTRRLYRSGDSEYLLNKVPCRLKDVVHFFMDVGVGTRAYGIIEQGRVGWLVDARPEERRSLIDEAAGITRYKLQKKSAERKIEAAEQNLTHVSAVMAETKKQLATITRQAAKAARYKAYKSELRELDLSLSAKSLLEKRRQKKELNQTQTENQNLLAMIIAGGDRVDLDLEKLQLDLRQVETDLAEKTSLWHHLEGDFRTLDKENEFVIESLEKSSKRRNQSLIELEKLTSEKKRKLEEEASLSEDLISAQREADEARAHHESLREGWLAQKNIYENLNQQYQTKQRELAGKKEKLNKISESLAGSESLLAHHQGRLAEFETSLTALSQEVSQADERLLKAQKAKDDFAGQGDEARENLAEARENLQAVRSRLENLSTLKAQAEAALAALEARLETLKNVKASFGWYPEGVKALMENDSLKDQGVLGPLAESLKIPEGYEKAVEAFLGEKLSWLLVKDKNAALAALAFLKEKSLGRCGFVSLADLEGGPEALTRSLLGDFQLAENLLSAALVEPSRPVLTKDGSFWGQGFLVGGTAKEKKEDAGLLARLRDIEKLEAQTEAAFLDFEQKENDLNEQRAELAQAQENLSAVESLERRLSQSLAEAGQEVFAANSFANSCREKFANFEKEQAETCQKIVDLEGRRQNALTERDSLSAELDSLTQNCLLLTDELQEAGSEMENLRDIGQEAALTASGCQERLIRIQNDFERARLWLDDVDERLDAQSNQAENLLVEMDNLARRRDELAQEMAAFPLRIKSAEEEVLKVKARQEEVRRKIVLKENENKDLRKRREDLFGLLKQGENELLALDFGLNKITEDLLRDWRVVMPEELPLASEAESSLDNEDNAEMAEADSENFSNSGNEEKEATEVLEGDLTGDGEESAAVLEAEKIQASEILKAEEWASLSLPPEAEKRRLELRDKISSLGEVSLGAIEEEEELSQRHNFYQTQYNDLSKAISDLKDSIGKINYTCKIRFNETFNAVDAKFREIFPILFEGGEGWISLTNPHDPLESGVEIHVHPPGKKIMVMSLLSGGEKALTALALIFALYLIKPSPFCLLDETDAPLDEANVDRFNRLLKQLSQASQIIMVTHNKRTMQISGTLYGVTMETPGVSKLVNVNLREAEALTQDV